MTKRQTAGVTLIGLALLLVAGVGYLNASRRSTPPVFSANTQLSALWHNYQRDYIDPNSGRTLDRQRNDLTTSEGQSYTLLRAVWEDDRASFDKSLNFTNTQLKHRDDALFAWQYGKRADGSFGILTDQGGNNTASDADIDIATALVFGARRWQNQAYLDQARTIISDIWLKEVVTIDGKPELVANDVERNDVQHVIVNPSYLSPAAFRIFAQLDPAHDWKGLVDSSYSLLERVTDTTLAGNASVGLPPNWIYLNRQTGAIEMPPGPNLTTNYGYDAERTSFRLAEDSLWNDEPRAKAVLKRMGFLSVQWEQKGKLVAEYKQDGTVVGNYEAPAMYGASLGYFKIADTADYDAYYNAKLQSLYDPNTQAWKQRLSYYDDNWAWLGMALHEGGIIDLSK